MIPLSQIARKIPAKADAQSLEWLPLWIHAEDTANMLQWLYENWLPPQEREAMFPDVPSIYRKSMLALTGLLHDLGKATPVFAAHIVNTSGIQELKERLEHGGLPPYWPREYKVTHAEAGEALLFSKYHANEGFASVIGGHHGKPKGTGWNSNELITNYGHMLFGLKEHQNITIPWENIQNHIVLFAEEKAGMSVQAFPQLPQSAQMLLCGLLIMSDWLASNSRYFPLLSLDDTGKNVNTESRFNAALLRLKLPPPWQPEADETFLDTIYDLRFGSGELVFKPRPLQEEAARIAAETQFPGLMIMEAPMGIGKTEAALVMAELMATNAGSGGIFFGLPTQATSNAIFTRVKDWAARQSEETVHSIMLAHRMATFQPDYRSLLEGNSEDIHTEESGLEVHGFFQGKKTALLSGFTVGTVDQLLMAALKRKHVMLRHLGLAGKVIIIDEVHAYDAYMTSYLQRALRWLGEWKVPVILLSATLPSAQRAKLLKAYTGTKRKKQEPTEEEKNTEYPLLTWTSGQKEFQKKLSLNEDNKIVEWKAIRDEERIILLKDAIKNGGCVGIVCNTVGRAQRVAEEISNSFPGTEVIVYHAQFTVPDRAVIEKMVLEKLGKRGKRPERLIVVGTQVMEQSLDIDLDLLITDLCPMDLLLQRIGRLHRHKRERPVAMEQACCWITGFDDADIHEQRIYDEYLMLRTKAVLPEKIRIPGDIATLVHLVYGDEPVSGDERDSFKKAKEKREVNIRKLESQAEVYQLGVPATFSRFKDSTIHGILDRKAEGNDMAAEASVRAGSPSVEVLLMKEEEGFARFVSEEHSVVSMNCTPSLEESLAIARQRLCLPWKLCAPWNFDKTVQALEKMTANMPEWQAAPWIQGELILMLNREGRAKINEWIVRYDRKYGLICDKADQTDNSGI